MAAAAHPAVDPAQAAAAYQRAQDAMRDEAERRRTEADAAQEVSTE